ncbi:MAG: DUF4145 domain-containing protein [Euryarchaeota archaeon]|nr:DUF4145 domain-containing protein [Euryarchaeota archaeon]
MDLPITLILVACAGCERGSLFSAIGDNWEDMNQLFPGPNQLAEDVPAKIRDAYAQATRVSSVSQAAYVVLVGRALEFMMHDQEAEGEKLYHQIENLAKRGTLPPRFVEIAHAIRDMRNSGAHADDKTISMHDAWILGDLFRAMADYIYVAPRKLKRLEAALKKHRHRRTDSRRITKT